MSSRGLILSGGIYHPFAETSAAVAAHLASSDIDCEILPVREGLARLAIEKFDLLVVNALAFSMTQAEKYAPLRARQAFRPSDAEKAAIRDHLGRGGGLLGLHTASICFDDWPEWRDLLGAGWVWGQSHHPMPDYVTVTGKGGFTLWDELYCALDLAEGTEVLAMARCEAVPEPQPVLTRKAGAVYLALGHDLTACAQPGFANLLRHAAGLALVSPERLV